MESYFNDLRNNTLQINKKMKMIPRLMPSEMIAKTFPVLRAKYVEYYKDQYEKNYSQDERNYNDYNEKWSMGSKRKRSTSYFESDQVGSLITSKPYK